MNELERCKAALRAMAADLSHAQDEERRRIAGGLHDDLGQLLVTARLRLATPGADDGAGDVVGEVVGLLDKAIATTRRLSFELMAPPTIDLHTDAAIASLADMMEERYGLKCLVTTDRVPKPLSPGAARAVFRVVRELLVNVAAHSGSPKATVDVAVDEGRLEVVVSDAGVGFEMTSDGLGRAGVGLLIAQERMREVGGGVDIDSTPGHGTRVAVWAPVESDREHS